MSRFYLVTSILVVLLQWRCCHCIIKRTNLRASKGNITTPSYPNGYPRVSSFYWYITVGQDELIGLEIKDLDLQSCHSKKCYYCDALEIFDGGFFQTFCKSSSMPKYIISKGRRMEIAFHSDGTGTGGRGLWLYYQALPAKARDPTRTQPFVDEATGEPSAGSDSSGMTSIQSTILVTSIVVVVVLSVLVIFCYGVKIRLSRSSSSREQDCPEEQTNNSSTPETQITDEEFLRRIAQPPSYDEAVWSSELDISIPPTSIEPNPEATSRHDVEAYDCSGLPSYNEALRISQLSLNRV